VFPRPVGTALTAAAAAAAAAAPAPAGSVHHWISDLAACCAVLTTTLLSPFSHVGCVLCTVPHADMHGWQALPAARHQWCFWGPLLQAGTAQGDTHE
jgi:hypothetical protein